MQYDVGGEEWVDDIGAKDPSGVGFVVVLIIKYIATDR